MSNFYEQFHAAAEKFSARTAIEVQRQDCLEAWTYAELARAADSIGAYLASTGVGRGDRCAILADNDARWCAAYFGALRLGAVAVPLDTAYKAKQVAALLSDSGAKVLFTTAKFLAAAEEAARQCGARIVLLYPAAGKTFPNLDHILAVPTAQLPPCPAEQNDPAVMLYTSGTTSDPKGVVLTHSNLIAEMEAVFSTVEVDERDALLGVLPLFHALAQMASLLLPFALGARVVFLESLNTTDLLRALRERGISIFVCVPQFFYLIHQRVMEQVKQAGWLKRKLFRALLRINGFLRDSTSINLGPRLFQRVHEVLGPRMRLLVTGGSRFEPGIGRDLHRLGFTILQAYGLTECSGAATVTRPGDTHIGSVGPPLPGVDLKIQPETGTRGDDGEGEVLIRGGIVMQGYYHRPDANAITLQDGWLHTGDLGRLDAAGRLTITGRKKEIIVLSSGKNLYPEEIEAHYLQSPYIKELCVMGRTRPDEPSAERLHAVVVPDFDVLRQRKMVNAREILRYEIESLGVSLPSHKRVLGFDVWPEELPRTTTRKLKRFEIERRARLKDASAEGFAPEIPPALTEEEQTWCALPEVARALEMIGEAARSKGPIRPGANIELELGLDSMERVELLTQLQQRFGTNVPEEVSQKIYTVRELVEAVLPREGRAAGGSEGRGDAWSRLLAGVPEDDPVFAELLKPKPVATAIFLALLKFTYALAWLLLRFRVRGLDRLPPGAGAFLFCPNHKSYLDPFLLVCALPAAVVRRLFFVGASEYFATPLMAWLARKMNCVPVDPDTNLVRAMQAGAFGLRHGKVLVIFPEGERSIDGEPKKFKKGPAILSLHLRAPIVPVALDGVDSVWARGRSLRWGAFLPWAGARIEMEFGPPISPPPPLPDGASLPAAEAQYTQSASHLRGRVMEMWTAARARMATAHS